ncbi:hypothetical protein [Frigoribacterium sp. PhB160]|uniref:hypothetical protein n=1 Tax=Frigoribacterium sp. PhB160 TaxID=2485192 RepID=UPI000F4AB93A|nr:hypothetical protein [Frigoribacterium sp. PhB160]
MPPSLSEAYEQPHFDRVAVYVTLAAAVHWAETPADIFRAHALGCPGTIFRAHALGCPGTEFSPDLPYVDVMRFESTGALLLEQAVGGPDRETQRRTGGPFLEHPPFTGSGFTGDPEHVVPVSWLPHRRVPAGAELYRKAADGSSTYRGRFVSAAHGWEFVDAVERGRVRQPRTVDRRVGGLARVGGVVDVADLVDDGATVVLARQGGRPEGDGWTPTTPGMWARSVPASDVDEYSEIDVRVQHEGADFRVVGEFTDDGGGTRLIGIYMGHDAEFAEARGFIRTEAGVYERELPPELLAGATTRQTQLRGWPGTTPAAAVSSADRRPRGRDERGSSGGSWWSRLRRS